MLNQRADDGGPDGSSGGLHFVLVPFLAAGHMNPMVDLARLLAESETVALVSVITTPMNASRFQGFIARVERLCLPIHFVELPFPCAAAGLPDGCENLDAIPSSEHYPKIFDATALLREPLVAYLRGGRQRPRPRPRPSCIISDFCNPWTLRVAEEFGVPRLVFHGMCCFAQACQHIISATHLDRVNISDTEAFVVPGALPHRIEVTRVQAPGFFAGPALDKVDAAITEADSASDGVVVNSFHELEPLYVERYATENKKEKVWTVGPVSLCNREPADRAVRGNMASIDEQLCRSWLDSMPPRSVVYASFGSITRTPGAQIRELGLGLEASGHPFVWVLKPGEISAHKELEGWLEGFEERNKGKALLIRGWAPQMLILSHPSVGGFVTHCGWNSSLEGISTGVPMITWPFFGDQFLNERLIVDVLRVGVSVGVTSPTVWEHDGGGGVAVDLVKREAVEEAVRMLMDGGKEGEERRERIGELAEKARMAMEVGGSSHENLSQLIQYVSHRRGAEVA